MQQLHGLFATAKLLVMFVTAHVRLLYTDYKDVAIVYVCHRLAFRSVCSAGAPGHVDVFTRAPSLADERARSMNDHLRYHGYDGVAGVVAKAGFNASSLATVIHRGTAVDLRHISVYYRLGAVATFIG